MEIEKVGVIGCGQMGSGITQVAAQSGYKVVVSDVTTGLVERGIGNIDRLLSRSIERGRLDEDQKNEILSRITGTIRLKDLEDSDLVIEAVIEDMEEKKKVFRQLDGLCPEHTIFASNTSSLSITEMAMVTKRPEKFLGLHFFNPVPIMNLVEIVRTLVTSEEAYQTAKGFAESLGKTAVTAKDTPGFIANRLLIPYLLDAIRAFETGVATKEDIDAAMRLGLNHPMGPLALADLIGLDTVYYIANVMFDEFKDPKYVPPPLLKRMLLAGSLGRKAGKGFYDYS